MATFQDRIKLLRLEQGWKQKDLADMLNYGYTAISNYESGKNKPSYTDLKKIAEIFGVSIDYLIGYSDVRCKLTSVEEFSEFHDNIKELIETLYSMGVKERNYFIFIMKEYMKMVKYKTVDDKGQRLDIQ